MPGVSSHRAILLVTTLVVAYFLITAGVHEVRSHQLRQQEDRLRSEIAQIEQRHQRLQALREYLNSDEYIESVAREQLGLVREGETGFIAISTRPSATPAPGEPQPELWWDVLLR
jgi:cell division protein DivIC